MKQLRAIRILLATLFFVACVVCLLIGPHVHPMARAAGQLQIVLSAASVTIGTTLIWLLLTFLFGRIYCATACPIGYLSDIFLRIRRTVPSLNIPFRYRHRSKWANHVLWIYILCVIAGGTVIPFLIEPWNIFRNILSVFDHDIINGTWSRVTFGVVTGIVAGIFSFVLIGLSSIWYGREFCSRICPVGTALGYLQGRALWHIEIDPDKCMHCSTCEDRCRTQAIKNITHFVDETRCVRCFDCVADCPNGAIRYQFNRNRPLTPLFRKVDQSKS